MAIKFATAPIFRMLEIACIYHDIGKINISFQQRIMGGREKQILPHAIFSLCFLDADSLFDEVYEKYLEDGMTEKMAEQKAEMFIKVVANAIAYHHERDIPSEARKILKENLSALKKEAKNFKYEKIKEIRIEEISPDFFSFGKRVFPGKDGEKDRKEKDEMFEKYILIKGLLNRIDYASSAGENIFVEKKNDFLLEKMDQLMKKWREKNKDAKWNKLQEYMLEKQDKNIITIAQTGMGKTEAGLLWIGNNKGFFVLPLKTAINAIYERIKTEVVKDEIGERVGLLHSDTRDIYLIEFSEGNFFDYYESTRQLSLPLTVCTLDQIFDFVYRYRGFEAKLATLSYSKVVLDEIQMYSPDLVAYIIKGLKLITKMGGKFAILTATFPRIIEKLLRDEKIEFEISENFIKNDLKLRHRTVIKEELIDSGFILSCFNKNKVLVICNTVKEAQRIYDELICSGKNINLFHSKFIKKDRREKEKDILSLGNRKSKDTGIWIATQVVEASLDIDFDILITELSDLNGLLQRMGRCYRNRPLLEKEANCFIFIGEENRKNSGVGFVVDKDIYNLSRKLVKEKMSGDIYEEDKMRYVEELYTAEKLKDTEYYKKIKNTLDYLEQISVYEKEKADVKKEFRDITNYMIIPKKIYIKNKNLIDKNLNIISSDDCSYREKIFAKLQIRDLTLSIQEYEFKNIQKLSFSNEYLELGKYEKIYIVDCFYSFEKGLYIEKDTKESIIDDRFL